MVPSVVEQHAERAAFAVAQREALATGRHGDAARLASHDRRLGAHLDGLRAGGRTAERSLARLAPGPGASFLETWWDVHRVKPRRRDPLALAWLGLPGDGLEPPAAVAHAAWSGRCLDAPMVERGLADPSARALTLRALGARQVEISDEDRGALLVQAQDDPDPAVRLEAVRWRALEQDLAALEALIELAGEEATVSEEAAAALALASPTLCRTWLQAQGDRRARAVAAAVEMLGDPDVAARLLAWLDEPPWARLAASVLATLGGFTIAGERVAGRPAGFSEGPTLDPEDEDVRVPADALLPWPEPGAVREAWGAVAHLEGPILGGRPRDPEVWTWAAAGACQPVRQRALDRAAVHRGGDGWFDVTRPVRGW